LQKDLLRQGTVRKIDLFDVTKKDDIITIRIRGNAFLHNMIRIIVGTIVQMSREAKEPSFIKEILEKRDRNTVASQLPLMGSI
jgi:tRNA pseudouridine38-40 synthase